MIVRWFEDRVSDVVWFLEDGMWSVRERWVKLSAGVSALHLFRDSTLDDVEFGAFSSFFLCVIGFFAGLLIGDFDTGIMGILVATVVATIAPLGITCDSMVGKFYNRWVWATAIVVDLFGVGFGAAVVYMLAKAFFS